MDSFSDLAPAVKALAESRTGHAVVATTPLRGGGNNLVCRLDTGGGPLLAKMYFYDEHDRRDRLGAEFGMLTFLWQNGVRCIPEPLACDSQHRIGLYRFAEGVRVQTSDVEEADVQALAALLGDMWKLRGQLGASTLPPASDACSALTDYAAAVERRRGTLLDALGDDATSREAAAFILGPVSDALDAARARLAQDAPAALERAARTLSPSDHGFHNAIRTRNGWIFHDFEYAGWDDPAKMISDACWQPGVPMPRALWRPFAAAVIRELDDDDSVAARLRRIHPLVGLKWCLLMLNEFVPVSDRRRRFAASLSMRGDTRPGQLAKSKATLADVVCALREPGAGVL